MTLDTAQNQTEPDLLLLRRFIETGDPATFAQIVQRYGRVVYSASLRVLGDEGRAQDVSQETFFRLMQRPLLVTHSLAGWLHRTATHLALDVRRSEKSRRQREQSYGLDQQQARCVRSSWADVSPCVDQALNEIPEPARSLLIRHFLQGVPQMDLAVEMDVSTATLSRRIKAGLELLQQNLLKRGIYVSAVVLAAFCTANTHAAIPPAFVTEMAKMKLVGTLKQMPVSPATVPAARPPASSIRPSTDNVLPAKLGWTLISLTAVLAAYTFVITYSWINAAPLSPPPNQHLEPMRVIHDR